MEQTSRSNHGSRVPTVKNYEVNDTQKTNKNCGGEFRPVWSMMSTDYYFFFFFLESLVYHKKESSQKAINTVYIDLLITDDE